MQPGVFVWVLLVFFSLPFWILPKVSEELPRNSNGDRVGFGGNFF